MAILRAYEVHTRENNKWRIEAIFDDKDVALDHAKSLIGGTVDTARVVEETLDTKTDKYISKVVFRDTTIPLTQKGPAPVPASAPVAPRKPGGWKTRSPSPITKRPDPIRRVMLYIAGFGGGCVGLAVSLAYFLDFVR